MLFILCTVLIIVFLMANCVVPTVEILSHGVYVPGLYEGTCVKWRI
jgi:hypothetical protein